MQLKIMPRKKRFPAGRVALVLYLCQMISALEVPLDRKYERFKAVRPGSQSLPPISHHCELCEWRRCLCDTEELIKINLAFTPSTWCL